MYVEPSKKPKMPMSLKEESWLNVLTESCILGQKLSLYYQLGPTNFLRRWRGGGKDGREKGNNICRSENLARKCHFLEIQ